jgi:DNA gyrase inhibitor GyrI
MAAPAVEASDRRLWGTIVSAARFTIGVFEWIAESRMLLEASVDRLSIEWHVPTTVEASALRATAELTVDLTRAAVCVDSTGVEWALLDGGGCDAVSFRIGAAGEES